jgi:ubiquinone/menaquinone biosynthesis C-methylase UbiE
VVTPHPTSRLDFRTLDLDRLWQGRQRVTEVETTVIRHALAGTELHRVLEVGIGHGRITTALRPVCSEYVGIDVTSDFLQDPRVRRISGSSALVADVQRLPFSNGRFSAVVMIRVFDFLPDPHRALAEIFRVLAPGGRAVISFYPWPSLATYVDQIRRRVDPRRGPSVARLGKGGAQWLLPTSPDVRSAAVSVGFEFREEFGVGWEDFRPLRLLPAGFFVALAAPAARAGVGPHRFLSLAKPHPHVPGQGSSVHDSERGSPTRS